MPTQILFFPLRDPDVFPGDHGPMGECPPQKWSATQAGGRGGQLGYLPESAIHHRQNARSAHLFRCVNRQGEIRTTSVPKPLHRVLIDIVGDRLGLRRR